MNVSGFDPIMDGLDEGIGSNFDLQAQPIRADLDNDGNFESIVAQVDTDGDGRIDSWTIWSDRDNDGTFESIVKQVDTDGDGRIDHLTSYVDRDKNGTYETIIDEVDIDRDGRIDHLTIYEDKDNDGRFESIIEQVDTDSDGQSDSQPIDPADNNESSTDSSKYWHQQTYPDTCAIASQEFILDELTGQDFSEEQLRQEAIDNGWYTPGGGTPLNYMGKILEAHGIPVERENGCTLQQLNDKLAHGEKVMVAIDSDEVWYPDKADEDDVLANAAGMPGQGVNHAVQVIGIDNSDPDHPMVILNDPGSPNGQATRVPADRFMNAWEDSDFYMVSTNIARQPA